jgi:hypothetical protein
VLALLKTLFQSVSLLLFFCLLASCATPLKDGITNSLRVSDVTSTPNRFDGKLIAVKGWVSMTNEDFNLWETQEDHKNWNVKKCISLKRYFRSEEQRKLVNRKFVVITGKFVMNASYENNQEIVRLGACNNFAIDFMDIADIKVIY